MISLKLTFIFDTVHVYLILSILCTFCLKINNQVDILNISTSYMLVSRIFHIGKRCNVLSVYETVSQQCRLCILNSSFYMFTPIVALSQQDLNFVHERRLVLNFPLFQTTGQVSDLAVEYSSYFNCKSGKRAYLIIIQG